MGSHYNSKIVTDGLTLYLDAANPKSYSGSSNTWYDLSGNGNNGTLVNGPTYSSNNKGSIVFDGVDDRIECNNSSSLQITSAITINFWMYVTNLANGLGVITKGPLNSDYDYMIYLTSNSTSMAFYKKNSSGTAEFHAYSGVFLNSWKNISFTFNGTTCIAYLDGAFRSSNDFTDSQIRTSSNNLLIGRGFSSFLAGNISNVQIYNRALSASEIQQNFNSTRGRYGI